jgi:hypothetical protein
MQVCVLGQSSSLSQGVSQVRKVIPRAHQEREEKVHAIQAFPCTQSLFFRQSPYEPK